VDTTCPLYTPKGTLFKTAGVEIRKNIRVRVRTPAVDTSLEDLVREACWLTVVASTSVVELAIEQCFESFEITLNCDVSAPHARACATAQAQGVRKWRHVPPRSAT
jgi:hypothetical protein